jgi:hypothetical protein
MWGRVRDQHPLSADQAPVVDEVRVADAAGTMQRLYNG